MPSLNNRRRTMGRSSAPVPTIPYLYFTAEEGSSNYLKVYITGTLSVNLEYSRDMVNWEPFPMATTDNGVYLSDSEGGGAYVRGCNPAGISIDANNYLQFTYGSRNARVHCTGSLRGLINAGDDMNNPVNAVPNDYCFYHLFENAQWLVSAPKLDIPILTSRCYYEMYLGCTQLAMPSDMSAIREAPAYSCERMYSGCTSLTTAKIPLNATVLGNACYARMYLNCTGLTTVEAFPSKVGENCLSETFKGCTSLSVVPDLPAIDLMKGCYTAMFSGCTSLVNAPALPATTLAVSCYHQMFLGCTSLVDAPALPATTLAGSCYSSMFSGCTSLVNAPVLPATTLASSCYGSMFLGCTSLVNAPALPATTLAGSCYSSMFLGCTSLVNAPALPATTLADSCYSSMFSGCTSLVNAPALPATTLTSSCYNQMFSDCVALVTAPDLPALALVSRCYHLMFRYCSHLSFIRAMFTTTPSTSYTNRWVDGVASAGTFVKNSAATWTTTGNNGVPSGWTILYETP